MPPKRRDRATPLETATDVIENASLSHTDRYQTLAHALIEIKGVRDRIALFRLCSDHGYFEGVHLIASTLNPEDFEPGRFKMDGPLDGVINDFVESPNFTETQSVTILRLLITKGCSMASLYRTARKSDKGHFVTYYNDESDFSNSLCCVIWYEPGSSLIHLGQSVVHRSLPDALRLLLPKLDEDGVCLALIQAIGCNVRACCDVLVDADIDSKSIDFAVFLCAFFGRSELLERFWNKLPSKDHGAALLKSMVQECKGFTFHKRYDDVDLRLFQAAVYSGDPDSVAFLLKNGAWDYHEEDENKARTRSSLLLHCINNNFVESAKHLLNYKNSSSLLKKVLETLMHDGLHLELIHAILDSLSKKQFDLCSMLERFARNSKQFKGLLAVFSWGNFCSAFGSDPAMTITIQRILLDLVNQGSPSAVEVIKQLAVLRLEEKLNFVPTFEHCVIKSENVELTKFFLSLNDEALSEAAQELKSSVRSPAIKKLFDEAKVVQKQARIKKTIQEESDEDSEDEMSSVVFY